MSYNFDAKQTMNSCIEWIRNYFEKTAKPNSVAVIGISGGKDSTIAAALCAKALGKGRVFGVLMPNGEQADIQDAKDVCEELGIDNIIVNINAPFHSMKASIETNSGRKLSERAIINLPPRLRMSVLYAIAQSFESGRVVNTCNLSEDYVGYSTIYGDSAGDFAPLQSLTVTEIKAIGKELGLPSRFVDKTPSDGLCGKTDEDNLGFTYAELDAYIREGIEPTPEKRDRIKKLHAANLFKEAMIQLPKFEYVP